MTRELITIDVGFICEPDGEDSARTVATGVLGTLDGFVSGEEAGSKVYHTESPHGADSLKLDIRIRIMVTGVEDVARLRTKFDNNLSSFPALFENKFRFIYSYEQNG